jgi:uncharacterized protein
MNITNLLKPDVFPHPVTEVKLLETHISYVVLTGDYAYKIKKRCKFNFVDYSTLDLRHHFCLKELEYNRRLAPELYLEVVPIYEKENGSLRVAASPEVSPGSAQPIEYAVKMRQFPQEIILSARVDHHELTAASVDQFAKDVARFHDEIERVAPELECIQPNRIRQDAIDNIVALQAGLSQDARSHSLLMSLLDWTEREFDLRKRAFQSRIERGFVRRCHGDMHLNNLIQLQGRVLAFDCIEFNEEFQWIDVLSDLAFPFMDFVAKGRSDLAWRLLNAYLEARDDWLGLEVLRFYAVYRALVRAKVHWMAAPKRLTSGCRIGVDPQPGPWEPYIKTAVSLAFPAPPRLTITYGLSGSGKSTKAMKSVEKQGGLRIRSDVERNRVSKSSSTHRKYAQESKDQIYVHLCELSRLLLSWNYNVIVDATFLKHAWRQRFRELAENMQVAFELLACEAPIDELERRIANRRSDASEATMAVLHQQLAENEPLTERELAHVRSD